MKQKTHINIEMRVFCINRYPHWSHIYIYNTQTHFVQQSSPVGKNFVEIYNGNLVVDSNESRWRARSLLRINARMMDNEMYDDDDGDGDAFAHVEQNVMTNATKMWWPNIPQTLQRCDSINCMTWHRIIGVHTQNLSMGTVLFRWLACKQFITWMMSKTHYSYRYIIRTNRWFVFVYINSSAIRLNNRFSGFVFISAELIWKYNSSNLHRQWIRA